MPLSSHRICEIFAHTKGTEFSNPNLEEDEFVEALELLKEKQMEISLDHIGILPSQMYLTLASLAVMLLIIFLFIFFGIAAFTVGGSFSAVINSLLPMVSGVAVGGKDKKADPKNDEKIAKAIQESIKSVLGTIKKEKGKE